MTDKNHIISVVAGLLSFSVAAKAEIFDSDDMRDYQNSMNYTNCNYSENKDSWYIRKPTPEEIYELGSKVLVFEYYNSVKKCSDTFNGAVYHENHRFMLDVVVGISKDDDREKITLDTLDTPYWIADPVLILEDGEQPGRIILYPSVS